MPLAARTSRRSASAVTVNLLADEVMECGGSGVALRSTKARALLVLLAMSDGHRVDRGIICDMLWPSLDEGSARGNLRQALFALRRALEECGGPGVSTDGDALGLVPPGARTDVDDVLERLERRDLDEEVVRAVGRLGNILASFDHLGGRAGYWAACRRRELEDRVRAALAMIHDDAAAEPALRRLAARAALAADPANEAACRAAIRSSIDLGEPAEALRSYNALFRHLEQDLDVEPAAETQALVVALKLGQLPPKPPEASGIRPVSVGGHRGPPRVAVLPLRLATGSGDLTGFAAGLVEETVALLARLKEPIVISAGSTRGLSSDLAPEAALAGMDVDYALCGSLQRLGQQCQLALRLVELADGAIA